MITAQNCIFLFSIFPVIKLITELGDSSVSGVLATLLSRLSLPTVADPAKTQTTDVFTAENTTSIHTINSSNSSMSNLGYIQMSLKDPLLLVSLFCHLASIILCALILSETMALYKSFTYLLTYLIISGLKNWKYTNTLLVQPHKIASPSHSRRTPTTSWLEEIGRTSNLAQNSRRRRPAPGLRSSHCLEEGQG